MIYVELEDLTHKNRIESTTISNFYREIPAKDL